MANTNNNIAEGELSALSMEALGLTKQPFANEVLSSKNFFEHQALSKIIDSLMHQVQFSDLLLLVEGNHGAGKTALFRQFIQQEITNTKILSIQAEATDTLAQIQQKMSMHLQDLGDESQLDENLKSLQTFDQVPLVCMDSSHALSDTTLQELLRYQQQLKQEHGISLKILFFANTGMADTLQKISDLQADQMYVQNIPGLSPKQADSFLLHRLRCADYTGDPLLDNDDIESFILNTATPLDTMTVAAQLINKKIQEQNRPQSNMLKKLSIGTIIVLILVAGSYFAFDLINHQPIEDAHEIKTHTSDHMADINTLNVETQNEEAIKKPEVDVIKVLENSNVVANDMPRETTETESTDVLNGIKKIDATDKVIKNPELTAQVKTSAIKPEPIVKTDAIKDTPYAHEPAPLNTALLQLNKIGLHDAQWLAQQNKLNWSLQLLGARDPQTLLKFSQRYGLSSDTAWYKTWLKEKPYYVLVHGSYANRNAARNAVTNLSPELQTLKPWVKSMKSIHKALP